MLSQQKDISRTGCRTTKRLLGKILVEGRFIPPRDLDLAIDLQAKTNNQLGEILVRMGVLDPAELKAVLSIQKDLASLDDAVKVGAGVRLLLGELLIKAGRLSREQLDVALQEQQRTGEKLGQLLVRQGLLMENELHAVLAFQQGQRGEAPATDKLKLGEILVTTGQITRDQLKDVLNRQKLSHKKIGELLIEAGYVEPHQVDFGLKLQQKLLTAALIAVLSLSNLIGAQAAYSGAPVLSTKIALNARVLEHTSLDIISQVQEITITSRDILHGYVDVPLASRVNVKTNNPAGYLLVFEVMSGAFDIFKGVNVTVGGREVQIPLTGGWILQPYNRAGAVLDVSCRFVLSHDAQPGTYSWPLMVSAKSM